MSVSPGLPTLYGANSLVYRISDFHYFPRCRARIYAFDIFVILTDDFQGFNPIVSYFCRIISNFFDCWELFHFSFLFPELLRFCFLSSAFPGLEPCRPDRTRAALKEY